MKAVLILGGAGFVGLNIAQALLAQGRTVVALDSAPLPPRALAAFDALPGRLEAVVGDVTDGAAIRDVMGRSVDALVLGAAITPGLAREAAEPEAILRVNLVSHVPALAQARAAGVRRIVNLSSAAAYGAAALREALLTEMVPADPETLYALTKFASERATARLAALWNLDVVSVRLSAVFGPWEHPTGVRDSLSPHAQIAALARQGRPAILARPGRRDWVYALDVAEAVLRLIDAPHIAHGLYNVSAPEPWPVLDWGRRLALQHPSFVCRLAEAGEAPTVDLHAAADRAPLHTGRLTADLGWTARFGLIDSADHFMAWSRRHGTSPAEVR